jgi:hypothetical protein
MYDAENVLPDHDGNAQMSKRNAQSRYPLLETMLESKGLRLQPTYTCRDVANLFGVTARTIQSKAKDGTIPSRRLIGGGRFLPVDLENYLRGGDDHAGSASPERSGTSPRNGLPRQSSQVRL